MTMDRRQVLLLAAGLPGAAAAAAAGGVAAPATPGSPAEKVLGIGGLFVRAADPKMLARWYLDNLGIALMPTGHGDVPWHTEAGVTVFAPFPQKTTYFAAAQSWMINFRVRDLDRMAAQLRGKGIDVDKHIGVLEQAELVTTEKVGRVRSCRLGPRRLEEEAAWLEHYRQLWAARFDALDTVLEELERKEKRDGRKKRE